MARFGERTRATFEARKVLKAAGIGALPVDLDRIARGADIAIHDIGEDLTGFSGVLLRSGSRFVIGYASAVKSKGFQRFSVAHELGHYYLPGHIDAVLSEAEPVHRSRALSGCDLDVEREADWFAAELLMPEVLVEPLARHGAELAVCERIADVAETSLLAASLRLADLSKSPIVVVVSAAGLVQYAIMSEATKQLKGLTWIRKGERVPVETVTADMNATPQKDRLSAQIDTSIWFDDAKERPMLEQVVSLGGYGRVLTILGIDDSNEDDDDVEDDNGAWNPQFSRSRRKR